MKNTGKSHWAATVLLLVLGTAGYTQEMIKYINPAARASGVKGTSSFDLPIFFSLNSSVYFSAIGNQTTEIPPGIYKTDGTSAGTSYFGKTGEEKVVVFKERIFFLVANALYGSTPQTDKEQKKDNNAGKVAGNILKNMVTVNGQPLGSNSSDANNNTSQFKGFDLVQSKNEIMETWFNESLVELNGKLYFFGTDKSNNLGCKLWESDGTSQGTSAVLAISCRPLSFLHYMVINNVLFFVADDNTHGSELWRTDGTVAGTYMVKDINQKYLSNGNTLGSNPGEFINVNGGLYFLANDPNNRKQLWKTDGTTAGTILVSTAAFDPNTSVSSIFHRGMVAIGNTLYFAANANFQDKNGQKSSRPSLWKTDGTTKGTQMIVSFESGYPPMWLTDFNGTLFFLANDGICGYELWKSNGTSAGTAMVKDINQTKRPETKITNDAFSSSWDCRPDGDARPSLTVGDSTLYFVADDGIHGVELWKSDGTAAGTTLVKDIKPFDSFGSNPQNLFYFNHVLYFTADDGPHGREAWKYIP